MSKFTNPTDTYHSENDLQYNLYGVGDTRIIAERINPEVQELLVQGKAYAREFLRQLGECELDCVSVFESHPDGEQFVVHCTYDPVDMDAEPGDYAIDFAFKCGRVLKSGWKTPPRCVRFSIRRN